jgi:predicted phosphodiesterase
MKSITKTARTKTASVLLALSIPALAAASAWMLSEGARPAAAQAASAEKVVGGPYAVHVGPRSATIMWVVETGQASVGLAQDKLSNIVPILRAEKILLTGLKPGTEYFYQSFAGDAGKGSVKTAPIGPSAFQFVVYGDTRTRHEVHRAVIASVLKYSHPDFVMQTGDLVENADSTALWPIFFDAERELLRKAAYFPALGNHEHNSKNYYDFMDAKPYYSFNWGTAHFTVINSDIANVSASQVERDAFWQEQTRWLEADLQAAQTADFRFVFAHHPPMTAVKRRQGDNPHMTALEPLFEKYGVAAAFFGHDHNYQHYKKNGLHYFITGGGGAPLYDVSTPPEGMTIKVESTENFVIVNVDGKKAHVEAKKPNGDTVDSADLGQ